MTDEAADDFTRMFAAPPGAAQKEQRADRIDKERRAQRTENQRKRRARRTKQINFRCTPEFMATLTEIGAQLDESYADVLEEALALLVAKRKFVPGGSHD